MRRHRERRRRLLWAAMLLGLVMLVAVLSVVDAGLRIYDHLVAASRRRTMFGGIGFMIDGHIAVGVSGDRFARALPPKKK